MKDLTCLLLCFLLPHISVSAETYTPEIIAKLQDDSPDDAVSWSYDAIRINMKRGASKDELMKALKPVGVVSSNSQVFMSVWVHPFKGVNVATAVQKIRKISGVRSADSLGVSSYRPQPYIEATLRVNQNRYILAKTQQPDVKPKSRFSNAAKGVAVDIDLVLKNTGKVKQVVTGIHGDSASLTMTLTGPGAKKQGFRGVMTLESRTTPSVYLAPGDTYVIPLNSLTFGTRRYDSWQWTKPGSYTLEVSYNYGGEHKKAKPVTLEVVEAE